MPEPERAGVVFGTAIGGLEKVDEGITTLRTKGIGRVNPFALPSGIPNLSSYLIAREFHCHGPNSTISTACATGTQAIGDASELIRRGAADVVITGGVEAVIKDFAIGGFSAMRALPTSYNNAPEKASRPFDLTRDGFVMGEGAGILILEALEFAQARGAKILCELTGYGTTDDAHHISAPAENGAGAAMSMKLAMEDAGLGLSDIHYINAHGTSTPLNDKSETAAIKTVFGEQAYNVPVSSTKSMTGHLLGASGAVEAVVCAMVLLENMLPPTINYETPDPECDLDYVPNQARKQDVDVADIEKLPASPGANNPDAICQGEVLIHAMREAHEAAKARNLPRDQQLKQSHEAAINEEGTRTTDRAS